VGKILAVLRLEETAAVAVVEVLELSWVLEE
jgi:hypothetical protein